MSVGTLTLHRFNGDEVFSLASAVIYSWEAEEGGVCINFEVEAERPPLQMLPDTAQNAACPGGEWTITLPAFVPDEMVGQTFAIPRGIDAEDEDADFLASFYYYEHEPADDNAITIIERAGGFLTVHITGWTQDVNFYDGSKPKTQIVVEAQFRLPETV